MKNDTFYSEQSETIPQYKIIILGLSTTGKTSLLTRYQSNFYDDGGVTTLSIDFSISKRPKAWYYYYDTCGQQAYRSMVSFCYKGSDACIIVYDVSSFKSFEEISYYYNQVKENTPDSLLYLFGCKADLEKKVLEDDVGKKYKGIKHFMTSAKTDQGVKEAFAQVQKDLLQLKPKTISQNKPRGNKLIDFSNGPNDKKGGKLANKKPCC